MGRYRNYTFGQGGQTSAQVYWSQVGGSGICNITISNVTVKCDTYFETGTLSFDISVSGGYLYSVYVQIEYQDSSYSSGYIIENYYGTSFDTYDTCSSSDPFDYLNIYRIYFYVDVWDGNHIEPLGADLFVTTGSNNEKLPISQKCSIQLKVNGSTPSQPIVPYGSTNAVSFNISTVGIAGNGGDSVAKWAIYVSTPANISQALTLYSGSQILNNTIFFTSTGNNTVYHNALTSSSTANIVVTLTLRGYSSEQSNNGSPNSDYLICSDTITFTVRASDSNAIASLSFGQTSFNHGATSQFTLNYSKTAPTGNGKDLTYYSFDIINVSYGILSTIKNATTIKTVLNNTVSSSSLNYHTTRYQIINQTTGLIKPAGIPGTYKWQLYFSNTIPNQDFQVTFRFYFYENNSVSTSSYLQTIDITVNYLAVIKNVLTSIYTDKFFRVTDLGLNMSKDNKMNYTGSNANILSGSVTGNYTYPVGKTSENIDYQLVYADDSQEYATIYYPFDKPSLPVGGTIPLTKIIIRFRAIREVPQNYEGQDETNRCQVGIMIKNGSNSTMYGGSAINILFNSQDDDEPEYHEITITGNYNFVNTSFILALNVGYYGGAISGYDIEYYIGTAVTVNKPKALVTYMDPGNYCGTQKTQIWPPIYDVTASNLCTYIITKETLGPYKLSSVGTKTNLSSSVVYATYTYCLNYKAESPNSTTSNSMIYANSGTTGSIRYNSQTLPSLSPSTYLGAYLTCYVYARSEASTTNDNSLFAFGIRTENDRWLLSSSGYTIANQTRQKYQILRRWFDIDDYYDEYRLSGHHLVLYTSFKYNGGNIYGFSAYVDPIKKKYTYNHFSLSYNRYDGPVLKESSSTGYSYLRAGAIKLIYSNSSFQPDGKNISNTYFNTNSYTSKTNTVNTANALYYTADSYTLFLKNDSNYAGEFKIPDAGYTLTSTTGTISPYNFGYYLCGYFVLPDTYAFGGGADNKQTNTARNYTGKNLVDFDTSTYISRYRFAGFSGYKGWTTKRTPTRWKLSRSDFNSNTNFVELTSSYDFYRSLWKPLNGTMQKEYIILSTSSSMTISAGGGSSDDVSVSNQSIYTTQQWTGDAWYGDVAGSNPEAYDTYGETYALTNNSGTSGSIPHWYRSGSSIYLHLGDYAYSSGTNWIGTTILTGTPSVHFEINDQIFTNAYRIQISCSSDTRTSLTQESTSSNNTTVYIYHFGAINSGSQVKFFAERMGYFYLDYAIPIQWKYIVNYTS